MYELGITTLQQQELAYPEGAWIASCGNSFPSHTQWLYKNLNKVSVTARNVYEAYEGEDGNYKTFTGEVLGNKVTLGSGKTSVGVPIYEHVSLDWVKWAISKNIWNLLYNNKKINATVSGGDIIQNAVREVLDVAVQEGIFTDYRLYDLVIEPKQNTISLKFSANLEHTILYAEVGGKLYH